MNNIKQRRFFIVVILCILVTFACEIVYSNIKTKKWIKDIDYVVVTLNKNHPNMYLKTSKKAFDKSINTLKRDVPSLKDYEIEIRLQEVLASLGDLHTSLDTANLYVKRYPLNFKWFKDKLIVIAADEKFKSVLGMELVKINHIPVKNILNKINKLSSYENEQGLGHDNSAIISCYYVLKYYGIADKEKTNFTFKGNDKEQSIDIYPVKDLSYENLIKLRDLSPEKSVSLEYKKEIDNPNYWYRYVKEDKILYFQYNTCHNEMTAKPRGIKNFKELKFGDVSTKLCETAYNNEFDKFIIDLRKNSGGKEYLLEELYTDHLRPYIPKVKIFIFTGPGTFSAAIKNAVHLKAAYPDEVIVLGEKPGQSLKFYSNNFFSLPNSKISLSCSVEPADLTQFGVTIPEVRIDETLEDYKNGIDPLYEWVKNYKNTK